jgi:hypothetical protein
MSKGAEPQAGIGAHAPDPLQLAPTASQAFELLLAMSRQQASMQATLEHLSKAYDADREKFERDREKFAEIPLIRATVDQHTKTLEIHRAKLEELAALKNKMIGAALFGGAMFSAVIFLVKLGLERA